MKNVAQTMSSATGAELQACIRYSWALGERVYAVADAARDHELVRAARHDYGLDVRWLFESDAGAHMSEVAPYLVPIKFHSKYPYPGSEYLDLWAKHLGNFAGILLLTDADSDTLWTHLRGVFDVTDEDDGRFFFRFYDPRVLRAYLPTCTPAEAEEFFGPIRRILVEGERPATMVTCGCGKSAVKMKERPLRDKGSAPGAQRAQR